MNKPNPSPSPLPLSDRRSKRRAARKEQMLDAALQLIIEDGQESLTIAKLAQRLDCAVGAPYRYFEGKDAIIKELQQQAVLEISDLIREGIAAAELQTNLVPPRAAHLLRLRGVALGWCWHATEYVARHQLADALLSDPRVVFNDQDRPDVEAGIAPLLQTVAMLLEQAVAAGALCAGDNLMRTHLIWAALHGLDHLRKRDPWTPKNLQVTALVRETIRTFLLGWGAAPEDLTAIFALTLPESQKETSIGTSTTGDAPAKH